MSERSAAEPAGDRTNLVDLLDGLLHQGVHVSGDATIGLADVELLRVAVRVLVASEDTARRTGAEAAAPAGSPVPAAPPRPPGARASAIGERGNGTSAGAPSANASGAGALAANRAASGAEPKADREAVVRGVGQLVLTIVELVRDLLQRQSMRRVEAGTLDDDQIERLGVALEALERRMEELRELFGLEESDLNIDLGPLGRLR